MKYVWTQLSLEVSPKTQICAAYLKWFKTNIFVKLGSSIWEELFINRHGHSWWHSWLEKRKPAFNLAPEIVFVNDEFVYKGTISCKSMYLTLDFSLIQKTLRPWKSDGTQIVHGLHRKKTYIIWSDLSRLSIPSHWKPVFFNSVPINLTQQNKSGIPVLTIDEHRLILWAFSL